MITTANFMRPEVAKPKPRYRFYAKEHVHYIGYDHSDVIEWKPLMGTSTVVNEATAKYLHWWSAELAAVECLESGVRIPTIREEYSEVSKLNGHQKKTAMRKLCNKYPAFKKARYAHYDEKNRTADCGHGMHSQLEHYIQSCIDDNSGEPCKLLKYGHGAVEVFADWASENVQKFLWSEKHCYSERLWVGGISDAGAVLTDGKVAIIDFKSSKDAYFSQFVQIGGYAREMGENGLFYSDGRDFLLSGGAYWKVEKLIVFPFRGTKPRIEPADPFMQRFAEVVEIYKHQQQYEAA